MRCFQGACPQVNLVGCQRGTASQEGDKSAPPQHIETDGWNGDATNGDLAVVAGCVSRQVSPRLEDRTKNACRCSTKSEVELAVPILAIKTGRTDELA
jgi:hypothetical protein